MKAITLIKNAVILIALVTIIKVTGVGDMLADLAENPAGSIPSVEIGK